MDFQEILAQASHNAQKANKVVKNLNQVENEQQQRRKENYERELIREREDRRRKAPPKVEKKFVIPKKPNVDKEVDQNALLRFKEKQRQEQLEKEKQRRKDCDNLIGLRLQGNQGKANKKIASQFGKTAIELQQRYAPNSHIELELLKRDQREKEELDRQTIALRHSIEKARCDRASALAQQRAKGPSKEKARIGNVRAGGFSDVTSKQEAVLTKRKAENFSTFASKRDKDKIKKPRVASSGGQVLDFNTLMSQAQQNSNVQNAAAKSDQILRNSQSQSAFPSSREVMKRAMNEQRVKPQPTASSMKAAPSSKSAFQQSSSSSSSRRDAPSSSGPALKQLPRPANPHALSDRQVLGPPPVPSTQRSQMPAQKKPNRGDRPMPAIPQPPPNQTPQKEPRYLPGDMRYKGPPPPSKSSVSSSSTSRTVPPSSNDRFKKPLPPTSSSTQNAINSKSKQPVPTKQRVEPSDRFVAPNSSSRPQMSSADRHRDLFGEPPRRHEKPVPMRKPERRHESRSVSNPAMFGKRGSAHASSFSNGYNYSDDDGHDEYDEEEDYDSEMDDFIDDSDLNELETADFEETLKSVNRNYNKKLWMDRERLIDDRRMEARYSEIDAEEKRSSRMALMEDYTEAQKGSRGLV